MTNVPFFDLKIANLEIQEELEEAVLRVTRSGWFIGGPEVDTFETQFANYVGAQHAIGIGNGMDALTLSLLALGINPGDEVIVPSHTFIATWLAVTQIGAIPVPVAVDSKSYTMDTDAFTQAITTKTKAVIPVHLYGHPAQIDKIIDIAHASHIHVIEDAAQAQGAEINGQRIGSWGDLTCWSFYPAKNLGALGDAGGITTNDAALAEKVRQLGNYGSRQKYVHTLSQCKNSRLDSIQAAILGVKLKHLDNWNKKRTAAAAFYSKGLSGLPLVLPTAAAHVRHVWHMYVIKSDRRDELQAFLKQQGIPTQIHYPIAIHNQEAYKDQFVGRDHEPAFKQASTLAGQVLSLPFGPHHTQEDLQTVVDAIKQFYQKT